jgi:hypothetical protein
MKVVIHSPSYNPSSGGIIALHKLCSILIDVGYDAGFYTEDKAPFYVNPDYRYNHFTSTSIDPQNDIVVYPEIIWGNPLNFNRVVRYIMNVGHITLGRKDTWGENDFWMYYSERFYDGIKQKNILPIADSKLEYFKDYKVPRVHKECYTYRKRKDDPQPIDIVHSTNAIEIPFNISDEDLIKTFSICERFYSYDTVTHLSVLASLCGCDSIIVPRPSDTREEVIEKSLPLKYGVAFGLDEIELARSTRPQLRTFLEDSEEQQIHETAKMFSKITTQI